MDMVVRTGLLGAGATATMDVWAAVLRRFGVPSLNFALLGRWIGHLPEGQFVHASIAKAPPVRGERVLGWMAHYGIGISFAIVLVAAFGREWTRSPTLGPAVLIGLATVIAPLFVLQPALGLGIASSKTPRPVFNATKSIVTHVVYGAGLYLTGLGLAMLPA